MSAETPIDVRALIDREPLGSRQILIFILLFLTLAIDGLDTQITSYLAPAIAKDWHVSMGSLGLIFGVGLVGSAAGALVLGSLGDLLGLKRVTVVATLVIAIATLGMGVSTSAEQLIGLRFVTGVAVGGTLANLIALGSQLAPARRRATLVTFTGCGFPAGATLAGLIATGVLSIAGWRTAYLAAGLFPLLLVPFLLILLPESLPRQLRGNKGQDVVRRVLQRLYPASLLSGRLVWSGAVAAKVPLAAIFHNGRAVISLALSAIFFLSLINVYFLSNWLPTLLQQAHSTPRESLVATTVFNLGGIVGALLLGRFIDRWGFRRVLGTSFAGGAACLIILALGHFTFQTLAAAAFVAGFFILGGQGGLNCLPALTYPEELRATGAGWAIGTGRLGSVSGPLAAGFLLGAGWNYGQVLVLAAVAPIVAVVFLGILSAHTASGPATQAA